mgnify:CR=1 FL=1
MGIDNLVCNLLDEPSVQDDNSVVFTEKALGLIHEIAERCKDIPVVKENQRQMEEYAAKLSAEEIYVDMLIKITAAPTAIHMRMSARLLIPIISDKMKSRESSVLKHHRGKQDEM